MHQTSHHVSDTILFQPFYAKFDVPSVLTGRDIGCKQVCNWKITEWKRNVTLGDLYICICLHRLFARDTYIFVTSDYSGCVYLHKKW